MKRKNFTMVPNELLDVSQLSVQARFLYIVLLKHCYQKESCFPGQTTLAAILGCGDRNIRILLKQLKKEGLIEIKREGWNRVNTYTVHRNLKSTRDLPSKAKSGSSIRNGNSSHLGTKVPLHPGNILPTNNTNGIKRNEKMSQAKYEVWRKKLIKQMNWKDKPLRTEKADF